jgi:hypothetical protein
MIDRSELDSALANPPTLRQEAERTAEDARQQAIMEATAAQQRRQAAAAAAQVAGPPQPKEPCADCEQAARIQVAAAICSGVVLGVVAFWLVTRANRSA